MRRMTAAERLNDRFTKPSFSSGFGGPLQSQPAEERLLRCEIEIQGGEPWR